MVKVYDYTLILGSYSEKQVIKPHSLGVNAVLLGRPILVGVYLEWGTVNVAQFA